MSDMSVSGAGLRLPGRGGAAGGTSAEQAVQRAQKAYAQAVERLRKDAVGRADQEVLKGDQAAVDLAAGALAQAQAALAREQRQAADQASARQERRASGDPAAREAPTDRADVTTRVLSDGAAAREGADLRPSSDEDRRTDEDRRDAAARRDRHRLDDAVTAVLSVDTGSDARV